MSHSSALKHRLADAVGWIGFTGVAQLVEQRSPKPQVVGSIPTTRASETQCSIETVTTSNNGGKQNIAWSENYGLLQRCGQRNEKSNLAKSRRGQRIDLGGADRLRYPCLRHVHCR